MNEETNHWLCQDCAKTKDRWHLPGISQSCEKCGKYAYSYYQQIKGKWEPKIIFSIHD